MPIQKILVPFDVSEHATEALAYAADLARRYDALLSIVYVDQPLTYALPEGYAQVSTEERAKILARFEHAIGDARRSALAAGAPRVEGQILRGNAADEIVHMALRDHYDLIVMGTHGRSGLAHALLGSVAERIVHAYVFLRGREVARQYLGNSFS